MKKNFIKKVEAIYRANGSANYEVICNGNYKDALITSSPDEVIRVLEFSRGQEFAVIEYVWEHHSHAIFLDIILSSGTDVTLFHFEEDDRWDTAISQVVKNLTRGDFSINLGDVPNLIEDLKKTLVFSSEANAAYSEQIITGDLEDKL